MPGGSAHRPVFDVIGIGFGPSNLALAIALDAIAQRGTPAPKAHFIEKQESFCWHRGMLLPDSDMQVSFLKDLVTLRDPTSRFTFTNYLHQKGRLEAFINQRSFFPSRIEFNDYLTWAATQFDTACFYGEEVVAIDLDGSDGSPSLLRIASQDAAGRMITRHARDAVIALGGSPSIPPVFTPLRRDPRITHSSRYLENIAPLEARRSTALHLAVIGGGQSAAEIALDLHGRFPEARIDLVFRGQALKPADDTPFVNEIFNPDFTDFVFAQAADRRRDILQEFRSTNYAVVDAALIERLYAILYQQTVTGRRHLALCPRREVCAAAPGPQGIVLDIRNLTTGGAEATCYDAVILATGYERNLRHTMLAGLEDHVEEFAVQRDYRLRMQPGFHPRIFVQGASESSHGLSDTLLSVLATRAWEIATALARLAPPSPDMPSLPSLCTSLATYDIRHRGA
ncbi:lysine N(6)-hydroxylase/L-ornithine N(5)-oxygenase family protein [Plastoroseomonas hellenica]|uniref:lysine N(6)-hydroxylase/L-ornithine N(5)-oxygenase family protein n=1 Tax=Plastoroseomonas hellenica TaxID=2687306 RepID=UPI001BA710E9|nr:SidA/IucD/PvdA family monooxygenase [Plastoroseomonas hellenica]MBR0645957.1 SidA/IucD/PvdA family monooxygenase [Plastoroseomonas hellenica]